MKLTLFSIATYSFSRRSGFHLNLNVVEVTGFTQQIYTRYSFSLPCHATNPSCSCAGCSFEFAINTQYSSFQPRVSDTCGPTSYALACFYWYLPPSQGIQDDRLDSSESGVRSHSLVIISPQGQIHTRRIFPVTPKTLIAPEFTYLHSSMVLINTFKDPQWTGSVLLSLEQFKLHVRISHETALSTTCK